MGYDLVHEANERLRAAQQEHFNTNREMQDNIAAEQRESKAVATEYERRMAPLKTKRDEIQRLQVGIHEKVKEITKQLNDLNAKLVSLQNSQTKIIQDIQGYERDLGQALTRVRAAYSNKNELLKLKERRLRGILITLEQDVKRRQDEQTAMLKKSIGSTQSAHTSNRIGISKNIPANDNRKPYDTRRRAA